MEAIALLRRKPPALRIFREVADPPPDIGVVRWNIDGHPCLVQLWSAEVFARLADPPADARQFPGGVFARLVFV